MEEKSNITPENNFIYKFKITVNFIKNIINRELTTNVCRKQPFCTYTQHGLFSTKLLVLSKQTLF